MRTTARRGGSNSSTAPRISPTASLDSSSAWGPRTVVASISNRSSAGSVSSAPRARRRRSRSRAADVAVRYTYDAPSPRICSPLGKARHSRMRTSCTTASRSSSGSRWRAPTLRTIVRKRPSTDSSAGETVSKSSTVPCMVAVLRRSRRRRPGPGRQCGRCAWEYAEGRIAYAVGATWTWATRRGSG